ncbi:MAG TPA: MFS transporter [Actinomycetota bacterium]|nr:MFS transporter [Actinomycetota bacterium]
MRTVLEEGATKDGFRAILQDRSVVAVILLSFVIMTGFGLVLPILPLFARSFGVGYQAAGLLTSAFGLTRLAADLVAGGLVDRMGERASAAGGLVLLGACALATALAGDFTLAVAVWALGGIGSALMFAAQYSYLLKVVPKTAMARTLGLFYGSFNVGIITGGVAGGILADRFGLATPLFVYSGVLFLASLLYLRFVPPPAVRATPPELTTEVVLTEREAPVQRGTVERLRSLLRTRGFVTVLVVNFAYMWMVTAVFDTLIPLFGQDRLDMSTVGIGAAFAVAIAV